MEKQTACSSGRPGLKTLLLLATELKSHRPAVAEAIFLTTCSDGQWMEYLIIILGDQPF